MHPKSQLADKLLSDSLFPDSPSKKQDNEQTDPLSSQVWRMYTKAKDTLPNGSRLENLTWRMMAMTLKNKEEEEEKEAAAATATATVTTTDKHSTDTSMSIDVKHQPPPADDTTSLLSSSAPPYMMMDYLRENLDQEKKNVLISGSSLAYTYQDQRHTVSGLYCVYTYILTFYSPSFSSSLPSAEPIPPSSATASPFQLKMIWTPWTRKRNTLLLHY